MTWVLAERTGQGAGPRDGSGGGREGQRGRRLGDGFAVRGTGMQVAWSPSAGYQGPFLLGAAGTGTKHTVLGAGGIRPWAPRKPGGEGGGRYEVPGERILE